MTREYKRRNKRGNLRGDESGQVLVLVAFAMLFVLGMAALAIDVGYISVVRHELQNAADASALAGAGSLFNPPPGPDWSGAETMASNSITWNKAANKSLSTCQVQSGYWNLHHVPAGLQSQGIDPGNWDVPAVKVEVRRDTGQNGGPLPTFFMRVFGIKSVPVKAEAVAVVSGPGYVKPGPLFPVAISKELADKYREYKDPAHTFIIGSSYHYPNGMAGQWTSFLTDSNNVPFIRGLLENGTSDQVNVNTSGTCPPGNPMSDCIYIQPGTKNTLYDNKNQWSVSWFEGQDVVLPVINAVLSDSTHDWAPVAGFIGFHVVKSTGGSTKNMWAILQRD